jgi:uncharacterized protein HemX
MQQFINTLFNPDVLDKLGLAGLTLVAIVVAVWLLLRYTGRQQQDLANTLTASQERQAALHAEAQRQQANAHAEALRTVKQSLDNNTQTLQVLNDNLSDLRDNMSDLRETVRELYGFIRYILGRDDDEKEKRE